MGRYYVDGRVLIVCMMSEFCRQPVPTRLPAFI